MQTQEQFLADLSNENSSVEIQSYQFYFGGIEVMYTFNLSPVDTNACSITKKEICYISMLKGDIKNYGDYGVKEKGKDGTSTFIEWFNALEDEKKYEYFISGIKEKARRAFLATSIDLGAKQCKRRLETADLLKG